MASLGPSPTPPGGGGPASPQLAQIFGVQLTKKVGFHNCKIDEIGENSAGKVKNWVLLDLWGPKIRRFGRKSGLWVVFGSIWGLFFLTEIFRGPSPAPPPPPGGGSPASPRRFPASLDPSPATPPGGLGEKSGPQQAFPSPKSPNCPEEHQTFLWAALFF